MVWQIAFGIFLGNLLLGFFRVTVNRLNDLVTRSIEKLEAEHPERKKTKPANGKGPIGFKSNEERC